ncbi:hypothetical protein HHI36_013946 [Cryptolaemus montrouzieri]|uniref:Uncharacterized protein n=1 Tax=Cryptolaemus montrouzieri TaxID=559131 RepID=A0ABD2N198_9CUCU
MDIKELAAKYIKCHNNPLNKIDLPTSKLFLEDPKDQKLNIEKYQNILKDTLDYVRLTGDVLEVKGMDRRFESLQGIETSWFLLKILDFRIKLAYIFYQRKHCF